MAGYALKIKAKLIVDNKDPKAMAFAAEQIAGLNKRLDEMGFRDIEVDPEYKDRLKADAVY